MHAQTSNQPNDPSSATGGQKAPELQTEAAPASSLERVVRPSGSWIRLLINTASLRYQCVRALLRLPVCEVLNLYKSRGGVLPLLRHWPLLSSENHRLIAEGRKQRGVETDRELLLSTLPWKWPLKTYRRISSWF